MISQVDRSDTNARHRLFAGWLVRIAACWLVAVWCSPSSAEVVTVTTAEALTSALARVKPSGHQSARHQLVAGNILEAGARIHVGRGLKASHPFPAENTTLAGNIGPVELEDAGLKHTGTKMLPAYDGNAGVAVLVTREQVGPGAPYPLASSQALTSEWSEDFTQGMKDWWAEGGERVWVDDGRLYVRADALDVAGGTVATVWCRKELPPDFELELDAHVIDSSVDANNINLFFCYTDPAGKPLEDSRDSRRTAAYNLYHQLNGYIATFVKEAGKARIRLRRNPGFNLLAESREGESRAGVTYRLKVRKQGGEIVFSLDGREMARATDSQPWRGGLLGLRTFRTNLWWDNLRVHSLAIPPP